MKFVLSYIDYFMRKYDLILFVVKLMCEVIRVPSFREGIISVITNYFCRIFCQISSTNYCAFKSVFLFMNW